MDGRRQHIATWNIFLGRNINWTRLYVWLRTRLTANLLCDHSPALIFIEACIQEICIRMALFVEHFSILYQYWVLDIGYWILAYELFNKLVSSLPVFCLSKRKMKEIKHCPRYFVKSFVSGVSFSWDCQPKLWFSVSYFKASKVS